MQGGGEGHRDAVVTPSTSAAAVAAPSTLTTAALSNMSIVRPVFMPETFTGTGREWSDWKEQFEMAAVVNNWNDGMKLKFMALLLSGRARDIYSGLSVEAKRSYVLLKDALGKCFEPCETAEWNRVSFSTRKRMPNETLREFGNALRRLATKAYSSVGADTQDLLARDHFIAHVGNGETRIRLRSVKPITLEEAINIASEYELIQGLEQCTITSDARVRELHISAAESKVDALTEVVDALRNEVQTLKKSVQQLCEAVPTLRNSSVEPLSLSGVGRRQGQPLGGGCWECGCNRHIRRDCPYVQGNGRGQAL